MDFILLESNFGLFIGRFHPLVVHLPIGFLLLAAIFYYASRRTTFEPLRQAVGPTLFLGALSAILSVIFGLALANEGGYDDQALFWHKWLGIGVALISSTALLSYIDRLKALVKAGQQTHTRTLRRSVNQEITIGVCIYTYVCTIVLAYM